MNLPGYLPEVEGLNSFPVAKAVVTAGLWANAQLERTLHDEAARGQLVGSITSKEGADLASYVDKTSEEIMAHVLQRSGYEGGIFGEEGIIINREHELSAALDGLDGTEAALRRIQGREDTYGPSAGIFRDVHGVIVPIEGAVYLPRQGKGLYGSTETGKVFGFKIADRRNSWEFSLYDKLTPFSPDRSDVKYTTALFLEKGEKNT